MNHETARGFLLDLAYGELAAAEARAVEAHLAGCEACRAERDRIASTRRLMEGLGEEPEPGGQGILMAAARQAVERPRRAPLFSWVRLATGLAVLMVVGGVTLELLSARRPDQAEERYAERPAAAPSPGLVLDDAPRPGPRAADPHQAPVPEARAPSTPPPAERAPAVVAAPSARRAKEERTARSAGPQAGAAPAAERTAAAADAEGVLGKGLGIVLAEEAKAAVGSRLKGPAASSGQPAAPGAPAAVPAGRRAEPDELAPAPEARKVARPQAAAGRADQEEATLVAEITRLRDEGLLNEARRRPEPCAGGDTARMVWLDGLGAARRFARTGPLPAGMGAGEATRDQWYDREGRLRFAVIEGNGPEGRFRRRILLDQGGATRSEDPPGAAPWPRQDLTPTDPAAAFWAPQRCGPAAR